jgi:hypothetical protein
VFEQLKKDSRPNEASSGLGGHRGRSIPVAMLLILVVLVSAGSGVYAGASFFAQQAPGVTVTTTIYTTTTSWTTSTIWSTATEVVQGVLTTVEYTTSTSTVTLTGQDTSIVLLLHMDGTDGSQTFVDSSVQTHRVTANGNARISTAQSKFGGASGRFGGAGDYLSLADSADWAFGTGDFTIDLWARFNALPSAGASQVFYSQSGSGSDALGFFVNNNAGTYRLIWYAYGGTGQQNLSWNLDSLATNTWYHFAVVRSGSSWYAFKNGVVQGSSQSNSNAVPDLSGVKIGIWVDSTSAFNGWFDEFRVSKGIARWTSNFTPPTAPY